MEKSIRENPLGSIGVQPDASRSGVGAQSRSLAGSGRVSGASGGEIGARGAPKPRLKWLPAPLRRLPIEAIGLAMAAILVVSVIQRDPATDAETPETLAKEETTPPQPPDEPQAVQEGVNIDLESNEVELSAAEEPLAEGSGVQESSKGKGCSAAKGLSPSSRSKDAEDPQTGMGVLPRLQGSSGNTDATLEEDAVDWEDQYEEAGGVSSMSEMEASLPAVNMGPVRYRLYPKSSEVLWQIQRLAERFGAQVQKANGTNMAPYSMTTESNYANLKLRMSPQRMESFVAALRGLGAMSLVEQEETRLYGGGMMERTGGSVRALSSSRQQSVEKSTFRSTQNPQRGWHVICKFR